MLSKAPNSVMTNGQSPGYGHVTEYPIARMFDCPDFASGTESIYSTDV